MTHVPDRLSSALAGRCTLEREVGAGGMATVYLARDVKHDRNVALKVLRPELGAVLGVERFLAEIKVTANLQLPEPAPAVRFGRGRWMDGLRARGRHPRARRPARGAEWTACRWWGRLDGAKEIPIPS